MKLLKEDNVIHINDDFTLINDNSLNVLDYLEEESVDAIVCDPPYELGFMGKKWDNTGIAYNVELWQKALRVLKPAGHLLAFGGTRTYHRIACAIEDAGFEIRDCIMWLYGSGFPKSHNIGSAVDELLGQESIDTGIKSPNARPNSTTDNTLYESGTVGKEFTIKKANNKWEGWGTALKPAYEPIIVARKPTNLTIAENCLKYGVGGINIDECRVSTDDDLNGGAYRGTNNKKVEDSRCLFMKSPKEDGKEYKQPIGRFPANVITDGSDEVAQGFPYTKSTGGSGEASTTKCFSNVSCGSQKNTGANLGGLGDEGSAMRYFYSAKASKKDRDEGLDLLEGIKVNDGRKTEIDNAFQRGETLRKNIHPTVKPIELMQYLIRLVSPKGATIVDIFNGSGSTGKAVAFENRERDANYKYIGIELSKEYCDISKLRIEYGLYKYQYDLEQDIKKDEIENGQLSLFDL